MYAMLSLSYLPMYGFGGCFGLTTIDPISFIRDDI